MAQRESRDAGTGTLLAAIAPRHWASSMFGVVSEDEIRRRPGDIARIPIAIVVVVLTALATDTLTAQEARMYNLLADLPAWVHSWLEWMFNAGSIGLVVLITLALLVTRRIRLAFGVAIACGVTWLVAVGVRNLANANDVREAAGLHSHGTVPTYPVVQLAVAIAGVLVVAPFLLRPTRHLVVGVVTVAALCSAGAVKGLPLDVLGSWAIGWGVAAAFHLAFGTPAATPTLVDVNRALDDLGVSVSGLRLAAEQVWGETRFVGLDPAGGPVAVDVIGRDSADARLIKKATRSLIYRDSGPSLALTRPQQLEHRAYILLLAARTGVPVSQVAIAGRAGSRDDAVLVMREPAGTPLPAVDPDRITDAVLDDVWGNVNRLHDARIAHGRCMAANVLLGDDGTTAIVDFRERIVTRAPRPLRA